MRSRRGLTAKWTGRRQGRALEDESQRSTDVDDALEIQPTWIEGQGGVQRRTLSEGRRSRRALWFLGERQEKPIRKELSS